MTPQPGPEEARLILKLAVLPAFRIEHMLTRRVLTAIPPEHVAYRPPADARTAWDLARHIVAAELRFLEVSCSLR